MCVLYGVKDYVEFFNFLFFIVLCNCLFICIICFIIFMVWGGEIVFVVFLYKYVGVLLFNVVVIMC